MTRSPRTLLTLGVVVVMVAVFVAVVMFLVGRGRIDDAVRSLARAPVGCDTTLEFSDTGTFVVFVETMGRIEQLEGGCDAPTTYDRRGAGVPDVSIEVTGPTPQEVTVSTTDARGYDVEGFVGTPTGELAIDAAGRYVVRVSSADDDFAVAIGRDPDMAARPLWIGAALIALAGLAGGATMVAMGVTRRRRGETSSNGEAPPPPEFVPGDEPPSSPPLAPPPPGTTVAPPRRDPAPWPPPNGVPVTQPSSGDEHG